MEDSEADTDLAKEVPSPALADAVHAAADADQQNQSFFMGSASTTVAEETTSVALSTENSIQATSVKGDRPDETIDFEAVLEDPCKDTIFEDVEDEVQHLRDRVGVLSKALSASREEVAFLTDAGSCLQEAYEALQQEIQEMVGDTAYWKALAEARAEELTAVANGPKVALRAKSATTTIAMPLLSSLTEPKTWKSLAEACPEEFATATRAPDVRPLVAVAPVASVPAAAAAKSQTTEDVAASDWASIPENEGGEASQTLSSTLRVRGQELAEQHKEPSEGISIAPQENKKESAQDSGCLLADDNKALSSEVAEPPAAKESVEPSRCLQATYMTPREQLRAAAAEARADDERKRLIRKSGEQSGVKGDAAAGIAVSGSCDALKPDAVNHHTSSAASVSSVTQSAVVDESSCQRSLQPRVRTYSETSPSGFASPQHSVCSSAGAPSSYISVASGGISGSHRRLGTGSVCSVSSSGSGSKWGPGSAPKRCPALGVPSRRPGRPSLEASNSHSAPYIPPGCTRSRSAGSSKSPRRTTDSTRSAALVTVWEEKRQSQEQHHRYTGSAGGSFPLTSASPIRLTGSTQKLAVGTPGGAFEASRPYAPEHTSRSPQKFPAPKRNLDAWMRSMSP